MNPDQPQASDEQPRYLALADQLEARLVDLAPGDRVMSEHDLVAAENVSRLTARAALQELERRFLVRRTRGSGTYVTRRLDFPLGPDLSPSAAEMERRAGATSASRVLATRVRRPTTAIRNLLDVDPGEPVVSITRNGLIEGTPAWHGITHIPREVAPGVEDRVADDDSIIELLTIEFGLRPVLAWARADLEVASAAVTAQLEVEGRPLVWSIEIGVWDAGLDRTIAVAQRWLRTDVFRVRFETGAR